MPLVFCFGQKRETFTTAITPITEELQKHFFQEKKVLSTIFINSKHYFGTLLVYAWDCRFHEVAHLSLTKATEPMHRQF